MRDPAVISGGGWSSLAPSWSASSSSVSRKRSPASPGSRCRKRRRERLTAQATAQSAPYLLQAAAPSLARGMLDAEFFE
ncbi:hypothetical protein NDU88_003292 [Pleurodeles waltl]|uniref:Uncharacterized protein n=1 Tax=Pleurodeles waltl TaxID=8319 RepID=A0AAV7T492_PLEWA|nr:hypothetical protein NDU88_003292 [Pleurodeles waltl]